MQCWRLTDLGDENRAKYAERTASPRTEQDRHGMKETLVDPGSDRHYYMYRVRSARNMMRVNGLGRCWIGVLLWLTPVVAAVADTRLADAVKNRNTQTVHALLQQRAAVNTPQADGTTALHWAVHWNDQEIAELLLRAGANPNATTELGVTPLSL